MPARTDSLDIDVVVVGAGFAGLYMLHRLRTLGFRALVIEAGDGVGGTWYWNRYPGARCDVESLEYSYGFDDQLQQDWEWTERYATQPEILAYLNHVADRFALRDGIRFETRVTAARFDDGVWRVATDRGDELTAAFLVMATGCLSSTNTPDFEGMDDYAGELLHTGRWPHEPVDFTGRTVAVIGTGSSAIQSIPVIAEQAAHLTVLQRTPTYSVPAHNAPLDPDHVAEIKASYADFRARNRAQAAGYGANLPRHDVPVLAASPEEIEAQFRERWAIGGLPFMAAFNDLMLDERANTIAADFVRAKIRDIVDDPDVAAALSPDHVIGCKRLCVDTGYYDTYNRDNVELVDLRATPLEGFTRDGLMVGGVERPFDCVILATGFDAMTGALSKIDITGVDGLTLSEAWEAGPRTYLGLCVHGFPNMFVVTGPGSPSVLSNMVLSIEHHVEWISDCIATMRDRGLVSVEASLEAQEQWVEYVNVIASFTLFPQCNSWYLGANVPGKARVFMPLLGVAPYIERCTAIAANDYEGFVLSP